MLHTTIRRGLVAVLVPMMFFVGTAPTQALIGDFAIIANQITQIGQAVTMISHLQQHFLPACQQAAHSTPSKRRSAKSGNSHKSIRQLAGDPAKLIDGTVPWTGDFLNPETIQLANILTELKDAGANTLTTHWRTALCRTPTKSAKPTYTPSSRSTRKTAKRLPRPSKSSATGSKSRWPRTTPPSTLPKRSPNSSPRPKPTSKTSAVRPTSPVPRSNRRRWPAN